MQFKNKRNKQKLIHLCYLEVMTNHFQIGAIYIRTYFQKGAIKVHCHFHTALYKVSQNTQYSFGNYLSSLPNNKNV